MKTKKYRIINDVDYFVIQKYKKTNNIEDLKGFQEYLINIWKSDEECLLYSEFVNYKECNNKKPIKFPFIKK